MLICLFRYYDLEFTELSRYYQYYPFSRLRNASQNFHEQADQYIYDYCKR